MKTNNGAINKKRLLITRFFNIVMQLKSVKWETHFEMSGKTINGKP